MTQDSKLTLNGLSSGFRMQSGASCGLMRTGSSASGLVGYALAAEAGKDGVPFTQILLTARNQAVDPPLLELSADYEQMVAYPEVDLDLRYTDLPAETEVEVESSEPVLAIPRQQVHGSSLIGAEGIDLGKFATAVVLRLWIKDPDALRATSALSLNFSRIEHSQGGADRKVLLQKLALNLSQ